jgi:hypothetical protein
MTWRRDDGLLLRRRAGGEPFAGQRLADWVRAAGFVGIAQTAHMRVDMDYRQLARYVLTRLNAAVREDPNDEDLVSARSAAGRWADTDGSVTQCWTEITAQLSDGSDSRV